MSIIQLSELSGNYNKKSAHRWVGNFSLQILTDLRPPKTPCMTNLLFLARMPAFGLEDAVKSAKCDQDFRLIRHT